MPYIYTPFIPPAMEAEQTQPGAPSETRAAYSHAPLIQDFVLSAEDADDGETVQDRTALHCSTLQHNAAHCSTLQHAETHCSTPHYTISRCNIL